MIARCGIIISVWLVLAMKESTLSNVLVDYERFTAINIRILQNQPTSAVIFSCWNKLANLKLLKQWSLNGYQINIQNNQEQDEFESLTTRYRKLNVLLDIECEFSNRTLTRVSEQQLFSRRHKWLLFHNSEEQTVQVEHLKIPLDSQVTMVHMDNQITLRDVYQITNGGPLKAVSYVWKPGQPLPLPPPRDNYEEMVMRTTLVVVDDTIETFLNTSLPHKYHLTNFDFELCTYIAQMLNFRMKIKLTESWGYPINGSSNYTGVIGLLQQDVADWGAVGILMKVPRLSIIDYAGIPISFGGAFMFLKPSLSEITTIYILPFDISVWLVSVAMLIVLPVVLFFLNYVERKLIPLKNEEHLTWDEAISLTFGLTCEQGTSFSPNSISVRIAFAAFLLFAMFLIISYSANIVSLLQMSSDSINTLEKLTDSPFTLSMRNVSYFVNFEHESRAAQVKRLYAKKIYNQPFSEAFTTQEDGIENVRKGLHAFHGERDTYEIISNKFEEYEKCRYSEINMISSQQLSFPLRKGSPYREHIAQKVSWLKESGIVYHTHERWMTRKPTCLSSASYFVSVRIQDFYPALLILTGGIAASATVFISELMWKRYFYREVSS